MITQEELEAVQRHLSVAIEQDMKRLPVPVVSILSPESRKLVGDIAWILTFSITAPSAHCPEHPQAAFLFNLLGLIPSIQKLAAAPELVEVLGSKSYIEGQEIVRAGLNGTPEVAAWKAVAFISVFVNCMLDNNTYERTYDGLMNARNAKILFILPLMLPALQVFDAYEDKAALIKRVMD